MDAPSGSKDLDSRFVDDDSLSINNVLESYNRIEALWYQNKINVQRLHALECTDEKMTKELAEYEKTANKYQLENNELNKELKTK